MFKSAIKTASVRMCTFRSILQSRQCSSFQLQPNTWKKDVATARYACSIRDQRALGDLEPRRRRVGHHYRQIYEWDGRICRREAVVKMAVSQGPCLNFESCSRSSPGLNRDRTSCWMRHPVLPSIALQLQAALPTDKFRHLVLLIHGHNRKFLYTLVRLPAICDGWYRVIRRLIRWAKSEEFFTWAFLERVEAVVMIGELHGILATTMKTRLYHSMITGRVQRNFCFG
ncbi:uncharacterized protein EV420DRAFT_593529 [Desarmillaria tabescens]|uniref:Uncharacterized protein n=1 Tax=Armillaria tabescens TaxID=1929756 RepID=A0AA39K664_ARMTA|nr:uncharacterized protein EV420DRAFT_593529 [Desarmillaria tabescens]KAK0455294.1 hypothetical protein EV420DRAFT_593529 [Desarmillaria tabescens]